MNAPIKVDSHVHVYRTSYEGLTDRVAYQVWEYGHQDEVAITYIAGTENQLLESMARSGMDHAVILNLYVSRRHRANFIRLMPETVEDGVRQRMIEAFDARQPIEFMEHNRWACRLAQRHESLTAFINFDPTLISTEDGVRHIRDMVENEGARGLKLHATSQRYSMADERMFGIYDVCTELGLPIVGHAGPDTEGWGYTEPGTFGEVLKRYTEIPIVLAHVGGGSWRHALEIAQQYPNAYFDCCEIIEWTRSEKGPTDQQLGQLIKDIGPDRVMMGSDFPWYDLRTTIELVMALPVLSREEKEGILGRNAVRILKLPLPA